MTIINYLLRFRLRDGSSSWYAMAAWDQEDTEGRDALVNQPEIRLPSPARLLDRIATRDAFLSAVEDQSLRMCSPVTVHILAKSNPSGG
jgi:hypothetical protein